MSLKKTMDYIENNKKEYLARKKKEHKFICDHCLWVRDMSQKAPYTSSNEDHVYCQPCIDDYHQSGEW
jgi:hypothetical protein